MEVAAAAVGAVLTATVEHLCGCVCSKINTSVNLQSNLDVLVKEMENLMDRRKEVKDDKEIAEKEGNEIRAQVVKWLEDVEKIEFRVNPIQEEMLNNKKKPCACFLNCSKRYRASREVEEILEEIKRLLEAGSFDSGVVYTTRRPRAVEHIPGPSIQGQITASKALEKTMSLLYDDEVKRIGIWGLGGTGKTTLVRTLNNELNKSPSTQPFAIVIWVTVSKKLDIKSVQTQIARRLNLEQKMGENEQEMAIRLYQRLMNEEKFLLILDDVWEKVNLNTLGVPQPEDHKGCKILLTSRRMEVCRKMMTDHEVKINVLNDEEAWQLFCEKAGDVAHLEEIRPFAEAIARECCGLPLAIILVGAAMRRKKKVELWDYALKEMRRSLPSLASIEDEVYKPLKWSYDSLQGNNIKSCFLYCSLFPEDFSIEISKLVQCWLAEGLIDEQNHVDSVNTGIALIENLKDSCFLEDGAHEGSVKMHDVVRDVAIWIASSSKDGCKSLVRSGIGFSEISVGEFSNSNSLKRISFMNNEITRLPDCVIQCSEASTLLLQDNRPLDMVPERFLQGFEALRFLNLSRTQIQSLPLSLLQLGDLCALLLGSCMSLKELPPLGGLSRLQMLDLSQTCIRELPRGMESLRNLRQLDLSQTDHLTTIQAGMISRLPSLEVLDMTDSAYHMLVKGEEEGQTSFEEFRFLDRLLIVSIRLKRIPRLSSEDLSWINRLRGFHIFIGSRRGFCTITTTNNKTVTIRRVDISQESIGQFWGIANFLVLDNCWGLNEMLKDLVINSVGCFAGLKSLTITGSYMSLRPIEGLAVQCDLLPNLEELSLYDLNELESISELVGYLGLRFLRLKLIEVSGCSNMKYLLSCGDFIRTLPNLEVILVDFCENLDELFNYDSGSNMAPDPIVPNLRGLGLENLPKLRTLCRHEETWPCLELVEVFQCDSLRRLPFTNQNSGTIKEIKGKSEWWEALEWDDDETKSSLESCFRPSFPLGASNLLLRIRASA